jgi:hypothetical protein
MTKGICSPTHCQPCRKQSLLPACYVVWRNNGDGAVCEAQTVEGFVLGLGLSLVDALVRQYLPGESPWEHILL